MGKKITCSVAALALLVAACGSDGDGDGAPADDNQGTEATQPATSEAPSTTDADAPSTTEAGAEEPVEEVEAASCAPSGSLSMGSQVGFTSLDPLQVNGPQAIYLNPVYDALLEIGEGNEVLPRLATEFGFEGDTLVLSLVENATFSDGTPFDADAVVANMERGRVVPGPSSNFFADITAVEATGPYEVGITTTDTSESFVRALAGNPGRMVSPAAFDDPALDQNPVGVGPWLYDTGSSTPGSSHRYVLNENYWDPESQGVEEIEIVELPDNTARFNALRSGQVDLASILAASVESAQSDGLTVESRSDGVMNGITVLDRDGTTDPALADVRVRQAMAHAVSEQAVIDAVFFGIGSPRYQPMLVGELGHIEGLTDPYEPDQDRARKLLDEAGFGTVSFTIPVVTVFQPYAEAVVGQLNAVGFDASLEVLQPGELAGAFQSGDYAVGVGPLPGGATLSGWDAVSMDASAAFNPFGHSDPVLEELADVFNANDVDSETREAAARDYVQHALDQSYIVSAGTPDGVWAWSDEIVQIDWPQGVVAPELRRLRVEPCS